ncbi:hypothetical protein R6Q59_023939 [Mikania micrantha]
MTRDYLHMVEEHRSDRIQVLATITRYYNQTSGAVNCRIQTSGAVNCRRATVESKVRSNPGFADDCLRSNPGPSTIR